MKAFNGFKAESSNRRTPPLPAGPYVAKILAVKIEGDEPDQQLILRLDVVEGEQMNYFRNRYKKDKENSKFEPRYKGDYRIRIPNDDNPRAMYPESDKKRFNDMVYRIEKSNEGYHWDWNEQGLVGKLVGINMQDSEYNGYPTTIIGRLEIADDVRKGIVKKMPPKQPKGDAYEPPVIDKQTGFIGVEVDSELPF